jgi:hypothetical protein
MQWHGKHTSTSTERLYFLFRPCQGVILKRNGATVQLWDICQIVMMRACVKSVARKQLVETAIDSHHVCQWHVKCSSEWWINPFTNPYPIYSHTPNYMTIFWPKRQEDRKTTSAIWNATSSVLLTKQAMRKKTLLCTKSRYVFKLLLNHCNWEIYCINSTISTRFLRKKTADISFLTDVCLNIFGLLGECVCIHCFDWALVSTLTNETHVSSPVTHKIWLKENHCHLCGIALNKSKPKSWSAFYVHLWAFSEHILRKTSDSLRLTVIIITENSVWNLWKFIWKFWKYEAPSFTNFLVNTLNKSIHPLIKFWP